MNLKLDNHRPIHLSDNANKILLLLASFCIPFAGMLIVVAYLRIMPFGLHTLGISDGMGAAGGLVYFGRLLKSKGSFFYSFAGLGGNSWSSNAWGGLIPIRLLFGLFSNVDNAPEMLTWIALINIALCGLTMYVFISSLGEHKLSHLIFSTSYAMMGFNVVFFHEAGFMVGPQMLPLVILGLIWIMRNKAPWLYVISLGFSIFINAYFGFILCVVSVIVYFSYLYVEWNTVRGYIKHVTATYVTSSIIAGCLGAVMWLPAIKAISGEGGRLGKIAITGFSLDESFPFLRGFAKLFIGATTGEEMMAGLPNIFCGIFVVGLTVLFLSSKNNNWRRHKCFWAILVFYYLAFYIPPVNILMHGGSEPNGFFYRYSFVFSFFMILAAASAFKDLEMYSADSIRKSGLIIIIGTTIVFLFPYDFISGISAVSDLVMLCLMGFLVYCAWNKPIRMQKETAIVLIMFAVCGNLFLNFGITLYKMRSMEMNLGQYDAAIIESGGMIEAIQDTDDDIYRIEEDFLNNGLVGFDASLFGYKSVNSFGPVIQKFIHRNLCRLGLNWLNISHWYSATTPAGTDALLGLKYIVTDRDLVGEKGYERILAASRYSMYKNPNALSFAVLANEKCTGIELSNNAFDNVNRIWKNMTGGNENVFTEINDVDFSLDYSQKWNFSGSEIKKMVEDDRVAEETGANVTFSFIAPEDGVAYCYNTGIAGQDFGENTVATQCAGICKKGETVTGTLELPENTTSENVYTFLANLTFAVADNEVLAEYAMQIQDKDISFNIIKDHYLTGKYNAAKEQCILFSIPWDEGWSCYIDGQKVPIDKTWDLFMSVKVPEGQHTYEMKFFPTWMDYGMIISGAALAGLVVFLIVWHVGKKKARMEQMSAETEEVCS